VTVVTFQPTAQLQPFPLRFFTKLTNAQQHCVQTSKSEFHQNRSVNVGSIDGHSFTQPTIAWLSSATVCPCETHSYSSWHLKTRPTGCPETSVTNCRSALRDIPEGQRFRLRRCGSLNSQSLITVLWAFLVSRLIAVAQKSTDEGRIELKLASEVWLSDCRCLWQLRSLGGPLYRIWSVSVRKYRQYGHAVTQIVEALRYKPEGRGFDSRWQTFRPQYGPGVDSVSNRSEYQEYLLGRNVHSQHCAYNGS